MVFDRYDLLSRKFVILEAHENSFRAPASCLYSMGKCKFTDFSGLKLSRRLRNCTHWAQRDGEREWGRSNLSRDENLKVISV